MVLLFLFRSLFGGIMYKMRAKVKVMIVRWRTLNLKKDQGLKIENRSYCWWFRNPPPVEIGNLSHYLQGFITSKRWLFGVSEPSAVLWWYESYLVPLRWIGWALLGARARCMVRLLDMFMACYGRLCLQMSKCVVKSRVSISKTNIP